ncbi:coiled-coil domain-containing protein 191 [Lagopus leucura]|uniref:coiled-coil domain-containing protein 191 n=1 Tax=Lagopus leucura TaxID=30410 RepID=UPI001C67C628|nr:coiled-coil domain-containing protein 191 [Lagopus leucura]
MAAPRSTVGRRAAMALAGGKSRLFRWRRLAAPTGPQARFDSDSAEYWMKRVEQASEYAVSEAFSLQKPKYLQGLCDPAVRLETTEQLQERDEACLEARELLSNWTKSKLQLELTSDGEAEVDSVLENPTALLKYKRFDDLYNYLEHELESSSVQEYLQHLSQSEIVNCGIVENLRLEDIKKQKPADPRITMELRHKQVKENRLRRQKALELRRQEKALRKAILCEAKLQIQEEDRRKALKAKKEEEEIRREMVKLRKEMAEKRQTMAEAWRMEQKREQEKSQKLSVQEVSINVSPPMDLKKEEQGKEKQRRVQELLSRIHTNKQRCMQRHFSAWFRLILEHRIKMEKARALADWKCQQKVLRAWRNYTWAQKIERETQQLEVHWQDQNRKNQLSAEHNQRRLLRSCFLAWQRWSQAEAEKRELQLKREEMKRKMAQLLETVSLGKSGLNRTLEVSKSETAKVNQHQVLQQDEPTKTCLLQEEPDQIRDHSCGDAAHMSHSYRKPKFAWQNTIKHAAPSAQDQVMYRNEIAGLPKQFQAPSPKTAPAYGSCFEYCHTFQQHLIEEQKQQLQKQQELILELQENQRLSRANEEAVQATVATQALDSASQTKEKKLKSRKQSRCQNTTPLSLPVSCEPENAKAATQGKRSAHPIVKAMEERAIQRAERRRKLEEAKQQREEEKLAQLKAEEEAHQRKEAEEKEAQQEKRREQKRQQKLKELEKQRRLEKEQQLQKKARDHYEKALLRKLGMVPWKKLREQAMKSMMVAQRHYCSSLQRKCLMNWFQHTQERLMEKVSRAEGFFSHTLIRWCFRNWLKYKDYFSTLEKKASAFHAVCLKRKSFWAWFDLIMEEKSTLKEKLKIATEHCNKRLMLDAFKAWRQYPLLMKKEREREERRNQLRRRVAEILPDFQT